MCPQGFGRPRLGHTLGHQQRVAERTPRKYRRLHLSPEGLSPIVLPVAERIRQPARSPAHLTGPPQPRALHERLGRAPERAIGDLRAHAPVDVLRERVREALQFLGGERSKTMRLKSCTLSSLAVIGDHHRPQSELGACRPGQRSL